MGGRHGSQSQLFLRNEENEEHALTFFIRIAANSMPKQFSPRTTITERVGGPTPEWVSSEWVCFYILGGVSLRLQTSSTRYAHHRNTDTPISHLNDLKAADISRPKTSEMCKAPGTNHIQNVPKQTSIQMHIIIGTGPLICKIKYFILHIKGIVIICMPLPTYHYL